MDTRDTLNVTNVSSSDQCLNKHSWLWWGDHLTDLTPLQGSFTVLLKMTGGRKRGKRGREGKRGGGGRVKAFSGLLGLIYCQWVSYSCPRSGIFGPCRNEWPWKLPQFYTTRPEICQQSHLRNNWKLVLLHALSYNYADKVNILSVGSWGTYRHYLQMMTWIYYLDKCLFMKKYH